ncbi:MAG: hypothetical protein A2528_00950 [Candidatus Staskawiczbacteria bacterium RIFOXYD2_FULL_37_9]|uniref:Uncharacterized protein n=1 Tax=Candidatus Staskawiczbacteria bacterium RIFOXYB1_FULL_37_44 TaxID=1802223 RepID=A0A1G2IWZ3_9BACT|nr:MAG: hypothetical protein A2358_00205 [Candidatus Staskawiczbacteria bacterium RIFOXYB1_FULL_37_44]OGZ83700.1 MAG: hypothetical protein A2416_03805 [Candidatus Staskawiczbacteria bacterium RIFOXYC1_FULL_37_52]OGZ87209.1 MAG: hypothetical protein A2444_02545 [Candidatus Staskawiczbacteria bacterium RIFOXYC2_FULL_37_19]OGZ90224.1 MAG: hypothetical protein A2581_02335 [Candidatus Staskawiczbacteria bacterium RIFOXYD1_FULL_37_110]OGZ93354.1 MAG: hypothetical protein A2528_00950 [Candidatus Stask
MRSKLPATLQNERAWQKGSEAMNKKALLALAGLLLMQFFGCQSLAPKEKAIPLKVTEAGIAEALAFSSVKTFKFHVDMEVAMK